VSTLGVADGTAGVETAGDEGVADCVPLVQPGTRIKARVTNNKPIVNNSFIILPSYQRNIIYYIH
jgi:hypothetical protein